MTKCLFNFEYNFLGSNVEKPSAWNTWTWQQQQQWNWNWATPSVAPSTKTPIVESVNPIRPPYVTPILSEPPPSFPIIPNKQFPTNVSCYYFKTKYTCMYSFDFNYFRTIGQGQILEFRHLMNQINGINQICFLILMIEAKIQLILVSVFCIVHRYFNINVFIFIKNHFYCCYIRKSIIVFLIFADAAKRKQLPAWIREGLEKMEREKRRKIEREQSFDESENSTFSNENVSQELHHVKRFHNIFLTFNNIYNNYL